MHVPCDHEYSAFECAKVERIGACWNMCSGARVVSSRARAYGDSAARG
jgi:hypothetical protein